jgi:DNA-binding PadR family transcriptional regulator
MTRKEMQAAPLSYNATLVLQAMTQGNQYGFEIMRVVGLPSGTVYPLLRRLEAAGLVNSDWEDEGEAHADRRPARRYYQATEHGKAVLVEARARIAEQQAAVFGNLADETGKSQ